MMKRRHLLKWTTSPLVASLAASAETTLSAADQRNLTAPLDRAMMTLLAKHGFPGGALGVSRGGKLVYAKGFGFADTQTRQGVHPGMLFRIASVSKCFTAAAVLRLAERGKLRLNDKPFEQLGLTSYTGKEDPRVRKITVGQLLEHSGGWDKSNGDPLFLSPEICRTVKCGAPAGVDDTIRFVLAQQLAFEPGSQYAYSNFGYMVLGRFLEKITGDTYEDVIRREVLRPSDIKDMKLGQTLTAARGEVHYYHRFVPVAASVFPGSPAGVACPYGSFCLETNAANGGWIANVADLLRFAAAMDMPGRLLQAGTLAAIAAKPSHLKRAADVYYGLGWQVRARGENGRANLWHVGSLPGSLSLLVRLGDGFNWAAVFNSITLQREETIRDIQMRVHKAAREIGAWPEVDLF